MFNKSDNKSIVNTIFKFSNFNTHPEWRRTTCCFSARCFISAPPPSEEFTSTCPTEIRAVWTVRVRRAMSTGEGKVLKSESGTKSCLRTRELLDVHRDFTFKMSVYTPEAEIESGKRKIQVFLVEADDGSYLITETKGPSEAGWFLIESKMPVSPGIIYEEKHRVCKFNYCYTEKPSALS